MMQFMQSQKEKTQPAGAPSTPGNNLHTLGSHISPLEKLQPDGTTRAYYGLIAMEDKGHCLGTLAKIGESIRTEGNANGEGQPAFLTNAGGANLEILTNIAKIPEEVRAQLPAESIFRKQQYIGTLGNREDENDDWLKTPIDPEVAFGLTKKNKTAAWEELMPKQDDDPNPTHAYKSTQPGIQAYKLFPLTGHPPTQPHSVYSRFPLLPTPSHLRPLQHCFLLLSPSQRIHQTSQHQIQHHPLQSQRHHLPSSQWNTHPQYSPPHHPSLSSRSHNPHAQSEKWSEGTMHPPGMHRLLMEPGQITSPPRTPHPIQWRHHQSPHLQMQTPPFPNLARNHRRQHQQNPQTSSRRYWPIQARIHRRRRQQSLFASRGSHGHASQ